MYFLFFLIDKFLSDFFFYIKKMEITKQLTNLSLQNKYFFK